MVKPFITVFILIVTTGFSASKSMAVETWKQAPSPLTTRWSKDVSPETARPEYPRPNAVRKEWQNLNGMWEFAFDDNTEGTAAGWSNGHAFPDKILVPWTFEASLSGIGKGKEIHEHIWYRRHFRIPSRWKSKRVLLHFGAVDWQSSVFVNGKLQGSHRGGYTPFTYDITDSLSKSEEQEIVVQVFDPADPKKGAYQPKGKQLGSEGIWYTRTTGIWQTVWLEPVNDTHISDFKLEPDLKTGKINIRAKIAQAEAGLELQAEISGPGLYNPIKFITQDGAGEDYLLTCTVPGASAWSPEHPSLYDIILTVRNAAGVQDQVKAYTAFRSIGLENNRITLNGSPYFLKGVLDQGFWPDGIYTPPTDEAIRNDVAVTKAFGFNLARKHVKVEDPRWYYWCDRLGLLVAQDMPSSHNLQSVEAKDNFVHEWSEVMDAVRAHPCVALWVTFNENWGDPKEFQERVVDLTRISDSTRPIIDASGWDQRSHTDITDIHDYSNELSKHANANPARTTWVGEYGGVALPIPEHTWITGWGYQTVRTPDALLDKYKFLTDQLNGALGISGFVYTQLTDVEQELNGLMTYDRLPKAPPQKFAAINAGPAAKKRIAKR